MIKHFLKKNQWKVYQLVRNYTHLHKGFCNVWIQKETKSF